MSHQNNSSVPHKFNKLTKNSFQNQSKDSYQEKFEGSSSGIMIEDDKTAMNLLLNIKEGLSYPTNSALTSDHVTLHSFPSGTFLPPASLGLLKTATTTTTDPLHEREKGTTTHQKRKHFELDHSTGTSSNNSINPAGKQHTVTTTAFVASVVAPPASPSFTNNTTNSNNNTNTNNSNNILANNKTKSELYILHFYEPRFYSIYEKYQQFLIENNSNLIIPLNDHLLSLCLDHMITFCCWARKSLTITNWIKTTLDDNIDLRPEVRNGISMILMYCFSAAQAKHRGKDADMFSTLHDIDTGLGIVNKTSLKIYNDPYQYFNFIKSCITGLIDAGKIPENERINTPKKVKPQSESREEIEAFFEMKKLIMEKLANHEIDYMRAKVLQISNIWYRRQNIRSKRFVTAIAVLKATNDFSENLKLDFLSSSDTTDLMQILGGNSSTTGSNNNNSYHIGNNNNPGVTGGGSSTSKGFALTSSILGGQQSLLKLAPDRQLEGVLKRPPSLDTSFTASTNDGSVKSEDSFPNEKQQQQQQHQDRKKRKFEKESPSSRMSYEESEGSYVPPNRGGGTEIMPNDLSLLSKATGYVATTVLSPSVASYAPPPLSFPAFNRPACITAYRFDRISLKEWEIIELKIFQIDHFITQNPYSTFYFINEGMFSHEERQRKQLIARGNGMIALHNELITRNGLLSSWHRRDHLQMKEFLQFSLLSSSSSVTAQSSSLSLLDCWNLQQQQQSPAKEIVSVSNSSGVVPQGVIAYEVTIQIGLVIRKNESLGLMEDCWRMMYLSDLQSYTRQYQSFDCFLCMCFPQLLPLLAPTTTATTTTMTTSADNPSSNNTKGKGISSSKILLQYFSHELETKATIMIQEPPKIEKVTSYQTIGLLNESTELIFARFNTEYVFHDIVLQLL